MQTTDKPYHWDNDGYLVITDPFVGKGWWNYLFDEDAQLRISPFGQGMSWSRHPRIYPWGRGQRDLWIRFADGSAWCPAGWPIRDPNAAWSCVHAPHFTCITGRKNGLEVAWRAFIPSSGQREVWTVTLRNLGTLPVAFSLIHVLYLPESGFMGSRSYWDGQRELLLRHDFPHHAAYDDYEPLSKCANWLFVAPTRTPDAYANSDEDVWGAQPPGNIPEGVAKGLPSRSSALKPSCAALQYQIDLGTGESTALSFIAGANPGSTDQSLHQSLG